MSGISPTRIEQPEFKPHAASCICQICVCGKHKCPAKVVVNNAKFRGDTTVNTDYKPWPPQERHKQEKRQYVPNDAEFSGATTTRDSYVQHEGFEPSMSAKPVREVGQNDARFRGESEFARSYKSWDVPPRVPPAKREWQPSDAEFYGSTVSRDAYKGLPAEPVQSAKPVREVGANNAKFRGESTFSGSYKPWELPPRERREKAEWKPSEGQFYGLSEMRDTYTGKTGEAVKSCKPVREVGANDAKFRGESTFSGSYKPWEMPPREQRAKREWQPSEAQFYGQTENMDNYVPKTAERRAPSKPEQKLSNTVAEFRGQTTQREDYKVWNRQEPTWKAPKKEYVPTEAPFDGRTTTGVSYTKKEIPPCPSVSLLAGAKDLTLTQTITTRTGSEYEFEMEASSGHKFFSKTSSRREGGGGVSFADTAPIMEAAPPAAPQQDDRAATIY